MSKQVDFWFEFASPYSYLAAMRAEDVAASHGIKLVWRPFLLGVIFKKELGYADSPFNHQPRKKKYMWRDLERQCAARDLPPFKVPKPFPQNGLLPARLCCAMEADDRLPVFIRSVYRAHFQQGESLTDREVMFDILSQNGFDGPSLMNAAGEPRAKNRLKTHTAEASRKGLFGAPSFTTFDGELFWGDDRMEAAMQWACNMDKDTNII